MKSKNIFGTISLLIIGVVFGAILVSSAGLVKQSKAAGEIEIGSQSSPFSNVTFSDFNTAFIQVAEKVTPSIVRLTVVSETKENPHKGFDFDFPFNFRRDLPRERQGSGSGVIISEDGYILTNNHVVANAISVKIELSDKRELDAEVIGTDPLTDLAVIKVDADDLPAAFLGDSGKLKVGSWVMAIGNPLGYLSSTVTAGIVSATSRNIRIIEDSYGVENFIQTDAVINPGNSGGALVDLNGAVVGINTAIATNGLSQSYIGYGFAIPINIAKSVAQDLIDNGEVSRGYIGVSISDIDAATAKAIGLEKPKGIMIQNVVEDGAASEEDILAGDVILKIDDREINKPNELQGYVATKRAGATVELLIYRDGEELTRTVKLKAREKKEGDKTKFVSKEKSNKKNKNQLVEIKFDELGLTVSDLSERQMKKYKVEEGIFIKDVKRFSEAANQRLFAELVIVEVDKSPINSVEEFEEIVNSKKGSAILLKVKDIKGNHSFVGLEIPE